MKSTISLLDKGQRKPRIKEELFLEKAGLTSLIDPSWKKGGKGEGIRNRRDDPQDTYTPKNKYHSHPPPNNEQMNKNKGIHRDGYPRIYGSTFRTPTGHPFN